MIEKPLESLVLTVEEMAAALGLSRGSAYTAVREKRVPSVRVGRRVLVPREALERFLNGNGEQQAA